jgi:hypothetical protein
MFGEMNRRLNFMIAYFGSEFPHLHVLCTNLTVRKYNSTFCFYLYKTWSLALSDDYSLSVFDSKVLKEMFPSQERGSNRKSEIISK